MKLLLFDIDGTILHTHGAGRRSAERALADVVGRPVSADGISFSGKTDGQILREILRANEIDDHLLDGHVGEALEVYSDYMRQALTPDNVELLPGVADLVDQLHEEAFHPLALLTGNLETMAYLKLAAVGMDHYFPFGAFGSDHEERNSLPEIAVERARQRIGRGFEGTDVVVIGDTPRDIECCRAVGGFAVAVCTGRFRRDELAGYDPDLLMDDLADPGPLLDILRAA
jgi:phosphoglycolate phosphatase